MKTYIIKLFGGDIKRKPLTLLTRVILTIIGFLFMGIPLAIMILWIYSFNLGNTQAERVLIFNSYFPDFFQGRFSLENLSIVSCILAIILSSISMKFTGKLFKTLNIIILTFSILLLLLNLFQMM